MFANLKKELEKQLKQYKDIEAALNEFDALENKGQLTREADARLAEVKKEEEAAHKSLESAKIKVKDAEAEAKTIVDKAKEEAKAVLADADKKALAAVEKAKSDSKEYDKKIAAIAEKEKHLKDVEAKVVVAQSKLDSLNLETEALRKKFA